MIWFYIVFWWVGVVFMSLREASTFFKKPWPPDHPVPIPAPWPSDVWHWAKNLALINQALAWFCLGYYCGDLHGGVEWWAWVVVAGNLFVYWLLYRAILRLWRQT